MQALWPTDGADPLVRMGDAPEPEPRPCEAVVAVEAFSLNRGELFLLLDPRTSWMPGKDVAGRVVFPAADGSGPPAGTRVVGHPPARGWAQRVAVGVGALTTLPENVDSVTAAALPLAGLTALRLLRAAGAVAGRRVLLTGASGGVGHYVTELASAVGAHVTAVSASGERAQSLQARGAASIVHRIEDAEGPFDIVLESVGGAALARALRQLRRQGRLIWFGQASRTPATLDFFAYFDQTGLTLRHFHYEDSDVSVAEDLTTLVRLVETGQLHPEIGAAADWSHTAQLLADLRERRIRGNAVLQIPTDGDTR
jgi:NADPH:quinone reductase-like Zn-dependent oxidoreductase